MLMAENINYSVTSPTGISALQIGGTTIHSWARVGLANQSTFALIDMILDKRSAAQRWCDTAVLIIDEIS